MVLAVVGLLVGPGRSVRIQEGMLGAACCMFLAPSNKQSNPKERKTGNILAKQGDLAQSRHKAEAEIPSAWMWSLLSQSSPPKC
jgi:hypothetical protein